MVDLLQLLDLEVPKQRLSDDHSWCACWGDVSKRFYCGPTAVERLMTSSSRIGSIGGFVTCAKSCLK